MVKSFMLLPCVMVPLLLVPTTVTLYCRQSTHRTQ